MSAKAETVSAAAAWAQGHGCQNIAACGATPLEAFLAGAAAERDRWREHVLNRSRQLEAVDDKATITELRILAEEMGWTGGDQP